MHPLNLFQHSSSTTVFCVALATLVPELITFCFVPARALVTFPLELGCVTAARAPIFFDDEGDDEFACGVAERAPRPTTLAVFAARAPTVPAEFPDVEPADCDAEPVELRAFPRDGVAPYASIPPIKNANINNKFFNGNPPIIFYILSQK